MSFTPTRLSRDVLKLSGPDTFTLLQGLLTVNMDRLEDGAALYGALLTPQGKIVETMFLTRVGEDLYIDVPAGRGAALLKKLMLYRLRANVEMTDVSGEIAVGGAPATSDAPSTSMVAVPDPRHEEMGHRWLAPASDDLPQAEAAYLAHQLSHGIADMGAGFGEAEAFPLDVNLDVLAGIDHKKGCFVGQEVASRMFRKGEIRKRTYLVRGAELSPGTPLKQGERTIGEVRHSTGDTGLAMVRLDRLDGTETVTPEDTSITLTKPDYLP